MELEQFMGMISEPARSKEELKQVYQNVSVSDPDLALEVKAILDKRFPTWANKRAKRAKKASLRAAAIAGKWPK